uniref:Uncharacterized protein n=1 Tax=Syphacia muris TaxID=451379 RepID=A0A0N5AZR7_9BILA
MTLSDASVFTYSPSCSTVGTQCTPPPPVYENLENYGCFMDSTTVKSASGYTAGVYSPECSANDNPVYKANLFNTDTVPSINSLNDSRQLKYNTMEVPNSSIRAKKTMDMRPLSLPPPQRNIERRCYICLGLATIAVFGFAFAIWLLFDSLESFFASLSL